MNALTYLPFVAEDEPVVTLDDTQPRSGTMTWAIFQFMASVFCLAVVGYVSFDLVPEFDFPNAALSLSGLACLGSMVHATSKLVYLP